MTSGREALRRRTQLFVPADEPAEEVAHAQQVLEALALGERDGTAAASVDGWMVDTTMAARARRLLARAGRGTGGDPSAP